jgi:O-acetylhomoserine/O-acetylserine sulfhydrylase-like pyridoxal-dependent enzyme
MQRTTHTSHGVRRAVPGMARHEATALCRRAQLTAEQRKACGAGDDVIRLSIGLESVDDLIADIESALR